MQKPTQTATTSRRALFSAAAALPLAALPVVAIAPENPDAELLELHRALLRQSEVLQAISAEGDLLPHHHCPETDANQAQYEAAFDVRHELFDRIIDTPARTTAGRRAKADALGMAFLETVCTGSKPTLADIDDDAEWHNRLAWSLARDVLAEGRG